MLDFQVQNPNLYVYNAVIHLDELNPHAHVNFIPVGDNMKKGLSKQVSMNRALENMGYDAKFEVSSEAKNVKERGRIKLDNSKTSKIGEMIISKGSRKSLKKSIKSRT